MKTLTLKFEKFGKFFIMVADKHATLKKKKIGAYYST